MSVSDDPTLALSSDMIATVEPPSSPPRRTSASGSGQDNLYSATQTRDPDKLELPATSTPEVRGGSSPASRLQAKVLMMEPSKQAEFLHYQNRVAKLSGKVTAEDPDYLWSVQF